MRAILPAAAALLLLVTAEPARACGFCFDNGLTLRWWAWPAVAALGGVLFLEVLVTAVVWRLLRYQPAMRRRGVVLLALVLAIGASALVGGSGLALGFGLAAVLLPAFLRSLRREMHGAPRAAWLRVAGVALTWLVLLVPRHPSQQSTTRLVGMATYPAHSAPAQSWVYEELLRREDAHVELDARLLEKTAQPRVSAVELHRRLADPQHHAQLCAQLLEGASGQARERLEASCGPG